MRKKMLAAILSVSMVAAMLVGCGSTAQESAPAAEAEAPAAEEEAPAQEEAPAAEEEAAEEASSGELLPGGGSNIIYCITPSTSNAYFKTVQDIATAKGTELGDRKSVV